MRALWHTRTCLRSSAHPQTFPPACNISSLCGLTIVVSFYLYHYCLLPNSHCILLLSLVSHPGSAFDVIRVRWCGRRRRTNSRGIGWKIGAIGLSLFLSLHICLMASAPELAIEYEYMKMLDLCLVYGAVFLFEEALEQVCVESNRPSLILPQPQPPCRSGSENRNREQDILQVGKLHTTVWRHRPLIIVDIK